MKKKLILFMMPVLLAACTNSKKVNTEIWTAEYKEDLKVHLKKVLLMDDMKDHSEQEKAKWCDCMVNKFEKIYPEGVPEKENQGDTLQSVMINCAPWIKKK